MSKEKKKKEGISRLMELAGTKKKGLTAACTLSVLSSVFRIIPYFTIYGVLKEIIRCYSAGDKFAFGSISTLVIITVVSALLYGICAYSSAMLSHGAAFDILYELRMKLMEKMGRISSGYYTANTQGSCNALVGPSGGGKSTIAQLLLHFYEIESGSIKIGECVLEKRSPPNVRGTLSM